MARSEKNLTAVFTDTASAIRAKTGTTETICPLDFADKINAIETGGGGMKVYLEAGGKCGYSDATTFDGIINYSDSENVKNFDYMFYKCNSLTEVPNINFSNATSSKACFSSCLKLQTANINIPSGNMASMFYGCSNLTDLNIINNTEKGKVNCSFIAAETKSLQTVNLNIPWADNFNSAFYPSGVVSANLGQLYKQSLTPDDYKIDYSYAFRDCLNLEEVTMDIGSVKISSLYYIDLSYTFAHFKKAENRTTPLSITFLNADDGVYRRFNYCFMSNKFIESLPAVNCERTTGLGTAFYECTNLKELKFYNIISDIDLHYCTKMTREALVEVLNNLARVTAISTCTLGETNLAKLTDEDKAIATNKGWTLA